MMDIFFFIIVILIPLIISGCIGATIADRKEAGNTGFLLGAFLGPLGWFLAFFVDNRPECEYCRERISSEASLCPHCRKEFYFVDNKPVTKMEFKNYEKKEREKDKIAQQMKRSSTNTIQDQGPIGMKRINLGDGRVEYKIADKPNQLS